MATVAQKKKVEIEFLPEKDAPGAVKATFAVAPISCADFVGAAMRAYAKSAANTPPSDPVQMRMLTLSGKTTVAPYFVMPVAYIPLIHAAMDRSSKAKQTKKRKRDVAPVTSDKRAKLEGTQHAEAPVTSDK